MGSFRLDRLLEYLFREGFLLGLLWLGLAALTVALVVLMRTRWGQSRPLGKCLGLSLLAHLLFAGYATMIPIVAASIVPIGQDVAHVSIHDDPAEPAHGGEDPAYRQKPWEALAEQGAIPSERIELARAELDRAMQLNRHSLPEPEGLTPQTPLDHLGMELAPNEEPEGLPEDSVSPRAAPDRPTEMVDAPRPQRREAVRPLVPIGSGPDRAETATAEPNPVRQRHGGLPSSLFERPAPLPKLASQPNTPDPQSMLPGFQDVFTRPQAGRAAQAPGAVTPGGAAGEASVAASGGEAVADASGRMSPPSLDPTAGKYRPGAASGDLPAGASPLVGPPQLAMRRDGVQPSKVPEIYRLRMAPDRAKLAESRGATAETEKAVKAALKWLAANQEADGRWSCRRHGGGRELMVAGRDRQGAGLNADTGVTGLTLLALLASGHTHMEGEYQPNVRRGLEYLLNNQASNGSLGGKASTFAYMYCHAMATFALSEAYAMTKDDRLAGPVRRAIAYTLAAQSPTTGGWRYQPRDPGDTSQLGWQVMALKSAELGGIPIPQQTKQGIERFLGSVSSGQYGGLAAYRPTEQVSRAMTAEALVCRQFIGPPLSEPASREVGDYLLGELPGRGQPNLYYWYYATLGMYQLQGVHWRRWNDSLRATLMSRQQKSGPLAGSWNPDTRWAGYGGRVYSTALATLCLEVYYRFLPLYVEATPKADRLP